jgi:hypothetical protein
MPLDSTVTEPEVLEGLVCGTSINELDSRQSPQMEDYSTEEVSSMMFAYLNTKFFMTLFLMTALFCLTPNNRSNTYERTSFERSCDRAAAAWLAD